MQIQSAEFVTSANDMDDCPDWGHPEVAFIGRSNVGKSSLINMLSGRKGLAKISATPGKTRMINFFLLNRNWGLIDLPGYGFAKASRKDKAHFNELVAGYFQARLQLRWVFVLIDSRHSPQQVDLDFVEWLAETGRPFSLVFTKTDKLSAAKVEANISGFLSELAGFTELRPGVLLSSSKTRGGRNAILGVMREALADG